MKKIIISGMLLSTFISVNAQNTKYDSNGFEIGKEEKISTQHNFQQTPIANNVNLDDNGIDKRITIGQQPSAINIVNNTLVAYRDVDGNPSPVPTSQTTYQFIEKDLNKVEYGANHFRTVGSTNTDLSRNVPETYNRNPDQQVAPFDAARESYTRLSSNAQSIAIVKVSEKKVVGSTTEAKDNASYTKPAANTNKAAVQSSKAAEKGMNTNAGDRAAYAAMPKSSNTPAKATSLKKAVNGPSDSDQKK